MLSVVYFALINHSTLKVKNDEREHPQLFSVKKLPALAFDHKKIIQYALARLRAKIEYTNIIYSLLPDEFTMSQLQKTYEIITEKKLDKRNFIKKFLSLGLIKPIAKKLNGPRRRPARMYRFVSKKLIDLKKFF